MSKGFDELLTFPTLFIFRIIATQREGIVEDCKTVLLSVFETIQAAESIPSKTGRFSRIHIGVLAMNAEQLYQGYEVLKGVGGIRMVF